MKIPIQAAFASELSVFLAGIGPLQASFNGVSVPYCLGPVDFTSKPMQGVLPILVEVPRLPLSNDGYLSSLERSYSHRAQKTHEQAAESTESSDAHSMWFQLNAIQEAIFLAIKESSRAPLDGGCVYGLADQFSLDSAYEYVQALQGHPSLYDAAMLSLRAGVVHMLKDQPLAERCFRKSAGYLYDAKCYSAAAMLAEIAAMTCYSMALVTKGKAIRECSLKLARHNWNSAAVYWGNSYEFGNREDMDNAYIQGVKLLRGIVNGLLGEIDLSDEIVEWFLPRAALWHEKNGQNKDMTADRMYLIFREVRRESPLDPHSWKFVSDTIRSAAIMWCVDDAMAEQAQKLVSAADAFSIAR